MIAVGIAGCGDSSQGPNDPVKSGKELDRNRPPTTGVPSDSGKAGATK